MVDSLWEVLDSTRGHWTKFFLSIKNICQKYHKSKCKKSYFDVGNFSTQVFFCPCPVTRCHVQNYIFPNSTIRYLPHHVNICFLIIKIVAILVILMRGRRQWGIAPVHFHVWQQMQAVKPPWIALPSLYSCAGIGWFLTPKFFPRSSERVFGVPKIQISKINCKIKSILSGLLTRRLYF